VQAQIVCGGGGQLDGVIAVFPSKSNCKRLLEGAGNSWVGDMGGGCHAAWEPGIEWVTWISSNTYLVALGLFDSV
jgi:hypothetical protein